MNSTEAQKSVLTAMAVTVVLTFSARLISKPGDALRKPGQMLRIFMGGAAASLGLMALAKPQPQFARGLAWLVTVGAFMTYGAPVMDNLGAVISRTNWKTVNAESLKAPKPSQTGPGGNKQKPGAGTGGGGGGGGGW